MFVLRSKKLLTSKQTGGFLWRAALPFLFFLTAVSDALPQQATFVGIDAVREETLDETVPVIGRLVADQSGIISAEVAGALRKMNVEVGQKIKKGDIVATIESDSLRANRDLFKSELAAAQAQLQTYQAREKLAQQQLERLEQLKSSTAFNKASHEDAIQNLSIARAEVSQRIADIAVARARLRLAETDLARATIRAPYDGVVLNKDSEVGAYLHIGDAVVSLLSPESMEIEVDVPSRRLSSAKAGQSFTFTLSNGESLRATLRAILPRENVLTRTRPVRLTADLGAMEDKIADNQSITLLVPAGSQRNAVTIHKDAIIHRPTGPIAFVVVDGKAKIRSLLLGQQIGSRIEVLSGVHKGELAVVRGNERLQPDMPLRYQDSSPPATAEES